MGLDAGSPQSANDVLTSVSPMANTISHTTGFVNLSHINNVCVTSPNRGSFDTLATFSNNIIKEVPVTVGCGMMVLMHDFLDCSGQDLGIPLAGWKREED